MGVMFEEMEGEMCYIGWGEVVVIDIFFFIYN